MNLQNRINILVELGEYLKKNGSEWQKAKQQAQNKNGWFTEAFIDKATSNIIEKYLKKELLEKWATHYHLDDLIKAKNVGIVMAGNIPMVGFHDFLAVFISGHNQRIKFSSKDDVLLTHIIQYIQTLDTNTTHSINIEENLKGCDAYITTGGNQSATYFEHYFSKYPSIIRRNKTSIAILTGEETANELNRLSEDIHLFFGLGCRNVTKIFVPENYDFVPLLKSFDQFKYFRDYNKYINNYDFQLSLLLLNNTYYMTNESTLLVESNELFSPISVLNYSFYSNYKILTEEVAKNGDLQCIVGRNFVPFGQAQEPELFSYADGIDTIQFLLTI